MSIIYYTKSSVIISGLSNKKYKNYKSLRNILKSILLIFYTSKFINLYYVPTYSYITIQISIRYSYMLRLREKWVYLFRVYIFIYIILVFTNEHIP